jgi:hypothetical protein
MPLPIKALFPCGLAQPASVAATKANAEVLMKILDIRFPTPIKFLPKVNEECVKR